MSKDLHYILKKFIETKTTIVEDVDILDPKKLAVTFNQTNGLINKYLDEADMVHTYELVD
jgi:hypothetical protein